MKKIILFILMNCFVNFNAFSSAWEIVQLTDNSINDRNPQVDTYGDVAWLGYDDFNQKSDVFFYHDSDGSIRKLGGTYSETGNHMINATGDVAWGNNLGTFLFNGLQTSQIGFLSSNYIDINSQGQVVWSAAGSSYSDIYLYKNSTVSNISNLVDNTRRVDSFSKIGDSGEIVWQSLDIDSRDRPGFYDIFYYDYFSGTARAVDGAPTHYYSPDINSTGNFVFSGGSETVGYSVYLDSNGSIQQISTPYVGNNPSPLISDNNMIYWTEGSFVFMYDGFLTKQIGGNFSKGLQVYNDKAVWFGGSEPSIYFFDGAVTTELAHGVEPHIFDDTITWSGYDGNDWEIYKAKSKVVPEPATVLLLGTGLVGAFLRKRKK